MPNSRTQRVASLRRTVAVATLVVFMAVWGAVVTLGPGGASSSSASAVVPATSGGSSLQATGATSSQSTYANDPVSQAPAPLTTSQS
jgi:hypothetical protein